MEYEMEAAASGGGEPPMDPSWQVDSEWVDLTSSTPQTFQFVPSNSQGGRFLLVEHQTLRLISKSQSGHSYWVCCMPSCSARCLLDPQEKTILRYSGDHNHSPDMSRNEYKKFIQGLKAAVKENPQVKPKDIYEAEVERAKALRRSAGLSEDMKLAVPSFEEVRTAMYNTRNAALSVDQDSSPSKRTRERSSPRKKSTPSKTSVSDSPADLEELETAWSQPAHRGEANLSDLEDWLEDPVGRGAKSDARLPLPRGMVSPNQATTPSQHSETPPSSEKRHRAKFEGFHVTEGDIKDSEGDTWITGADGISRRKHRKRPASSSVFTCPHCPYKSNRHFNVQRHERLAHSKKKPEFSCKECGTSYSLEYRLKLHIKAVHQGEGHHCHICNKTFETMTGLKSHVVTKHKHEDPEKAPRPPPPELTCPLCGRVFFTKAHLQKHTATHVMVQPYRCFMCNRPFLEEASWLSHQSVCREPFTIQCSLCSKVLATPQELLVHMDTAHGRAEYSCNCGKSFPWKKSLLTHQQKCTIYMCDRPAVFLSAPQGPMEINATA